MLPSPARPRRQCVRNFLLWGGDSREGADVVRGWLAATTAIGIAISVPIAGATTFVVGGTNTVGPPSQASMQGLVKQKFIPQDQLVGVDYPAQLWPVCRAP